MEKESMEECLESLYIEHYFDEKYHLLDQLLILLGESVNTCAYTKSLNILMDFVIDKKGSKPL